MFEYEKRNKQGYWLFIFLLCSFFLNAQQRPEYMTITKNHIYYNLDSGYYDTELRVGMPSVLVKKTVYSKRTGKIVEEIIKISDTSVAYCRYDEGFNLKESGVLKTNREEIPHIIWFAQVPDLAYDPDGSKGLTKDSASEEVQPSLKVGYWVEEESNRFYGVHKDLIEKNYTKAGYYKNGERFGDWEYGVPYYQRKGEPEMVIQTDFIDRDHFLGYHNGYALTPPGKETLSLSGNWYVMVNSSSDSIYLYRKKFLSDNSDYYFDFYSTHSFNTNFLAAEINHDISAGDWANSNGILTLNSSGTRVSYRIEKIKPSMNKKTSVFRGLEGNSKDADKEGMILIKLN